MTHMTPAQAQRIARALLDEHGLTAWRVTFDNAKRRAGVCKYDSRTIGLSRYLMAQRSYEDTQMTITHEVAHALAGSAAGHGPIWQRQHRALGGNGQRCFAHVDESAPWMGTCDHGKQFPRYKAPKMDRFGNIASYRCRCPRPSVISWTGPGQRPVAPRPVVAPVPVYTPVPVPPPAPVVHPVPVAASTSRTPAQDDDAEKRARWAANKRASRTRLAAKRAAAK